jgi:peptide/nickel transport system permease protein
MHLAPGDPISSSIIPRDASPERSRKLKQYLWLRPAAAGAVSEMARRHVVTGDFGTSIMTRRPVLSEVLSAIANTLIAGGRGGDLRIHCSASPSVPPRPTPSRASSTVW